MITTKKTDNVVAHPKARVWMRDEPESRGDCFFTVALSAVGGLIFGLAFCLVADLAFVNGPGMNEGTTEASGSQIMPYFLVPLIGLMVYGFVWSQILPRIFKPTYFTNHTHRVVHQEYMSLSAASRSFAREAYDAVAAFDNPSHSNGSDGLELFWEAGKVWNKTYEKLVERESYGDLETHRARIEGARNALDTI